MYICVRVSNRTLHIPPVYSSSHIPVQEYSISILQQYFDIVQSIQHAVLLQVRGASVIIPAFPPAWWWLVLLRGVRLLSYYYMDRAHTYVLLL